MIVGEGLRKSGARGELSMKREENLGMDEGLKCVGGGKKRREKEGLVDGCIRDK